MATGSSSSSNAAAVHRFWNRSSKNICFDVSFTTWNLIFTLFAIQKTVFYLYHFVFFFYYCSYYFFTEYVLKLAANCRQNATFANKYFLRKMCVFLKSMINWYGHSQVICGSKGLQSIWLAVVRATRHWQLDLAKLICRQPHDQLCFDTVYCITSLLPPPPPPSPSSLSLLALSSLHCVGFTSTGIQFQLIFIYISICFSLQNKKNEINTHAYLSPLTVYMRTQARQPYFLLLFAFILLLWHFF